MGNRGINGAHARLAAAALLACGSGQAAASGFMIVEQSVHEVGRSVSGASAAADNPGTVFFNVAGMTYLEGTTFAGGAHVILPSAKFKGGGDTNIPTGGVPPTFPIGGGNGGDAGETGIVPNLYYVRDLADTVKFGLGINAPFGLVTEYSDDWVGRYHAIKSDLKTVNINPSLAFRVNDRLSLGVGVSAMYADVELTQAVDGTLACAQTVAPGFGGSLPAALGACMAGTTGLPLPPLPPPGDGGADGKVKMEGDDWGYGFNLGLIYAFNDATRIGFAYRSKVKQELEGSLTQSVLGSTTKSSIDANLDLPETASAGIYHRVSDRWALMADIAWTHWGRFDELRVESGGVPVLVQAEEWDDTWRYSLGVEFYQDERWTWRGGIAYDETPIPSAELRTPRIPGNDRTWLSFGFSYGMSDQLSIDFAYAHLFVDDSPINNTDATFGYTLTGDYENAVDIISAQLAWRF